MDIQENIRRIFKPLQKCGGFLFHKKIMKIVLVVKKIFIHLHNNI